MDQNAKSQAVEQIKKAQNVLVTVSNDPSVDQLSAAIGFTLLLNKLNKHATAVFSGKVPSTLEFLRPEETLEGNTNSLRDFIVSLDKSKADKLRYKVEDDVVRIYITPYRTSLSEQDLSYSQGDFNVDVVIALGVDNQDHLDNAIIEHGRILHDATIVSVMKGETEAGDIGGINWQDKNASSLCEMLMGISESLKPGVIDEQIATALLTGIVAETERFSNSKTTPKAMTMSAQLMSAGANQQLISESLTEPEPIPEPEQVVEPTLAQVQPPQEEEIEEDDEEEDEPGVLNLHHERDEEANDEQNEEGLQDHHIGIDEQGQFNNAEQLREAVEDVQENSQGSFKGKTIQPIEGSEEQTPRLPNLDGDVSYQPGGQVSMAPSSAMNGAPTGLPPVPNGQEDQQFTQGAAMNDVYNAQGAAPITANDQQAPEVPLQRGDPSIDQSALPREHGEDTISDEDAKKLLNQTQQDDGPLPEIRPEHRSKEFLDHPPSTDTGEVEGVLEDDEKPSYEQQKKPGKFSKYLNKPPKDQPKLNSPEEDDLNIDPLQEIPSSGPMADPGRSTESPLLTTQHDAVTAPLPPSTPHPQLKADDGVSDPNRPLAPVVGDYNTLDEIEGRVEDFSGKKPHSSTEMDSVRDAVAEAADDSNGALNFEALDSDPEKRNQSNQDDPPPVPPPIMPPGLPN